MNNLTKEDRREALKEAKILEALKHPNIIRFREVYKTPSEKLCIVMDYANGGDLENAIKQKIKNAKATGKIEYWSEEKVLSMFT